MYISRVPISLNHDHAKSADSEGGAKLGTVKLCVLEVGHPPIMDSMTLKVCPLSYDRDNWHEPPPWVVFPVTDMLYIPPAMYVAVVL
jgi:hypothetical protein